MQNLQNSAALRDTFAKLDALRVFTGVPAQFWPQFLQIATQFSAAAETVLLTRQRSEPGLWREAFAWPPANALFSVLKSERGDLERLGLEAEGEGAGVARSGEFVAVRLETGEADPSAILVARLDSGIDAFEAATRLRLLAGTPLTFQLTRSLDQSRQKTDRFAVALDLLTLLNAETRFAAAAMLLCNETASRFRADRVSLGWLDRQYIRVRAISHTERFEQKMTAVAAIERAMDEALDQDEEVVWPAPAESRTVSRDHEEYSRTSGIAHLLSLPIRLSEKATGVLMLERSAEAFSLAEIQTLRLVCDQTARRLHDLERHDRWFGARLAGLVREQAARLVGVEHTGAKLFALAAAITLAVLVFGRADYRVEAPFILKSDILAQVPAPFDGYIDEVHFRVGDNVRAKQPLVTLDTRELLLQESAAIAEQRRFLGEAQKAESENNVADMRIAQAGAEEAKARLDLARHHLTQARVVAPFEGFVIEGDLRERIAAPVKQGEVLVKVANLTAIYAEIAMPERDIHEIRVGQVGEIAFASQPQTTFPIKIERVEPVAEVKEKGNVFTVRGDIASANESWWRPGMSGVCKVSVGQRNLLWIITHRSIDFLRLYFWW